MHILLKIAINHSCKQRENVRIHYVFDMNAEHLTKKIFKRNCSPFLHGHGSWVMVMGQHGGFNCLQLRNTVYFKRVSVFDFCGLLERHRSVQNGPPVTGR